MAARPMSKTEQERIEVQILDRAYQLSCAPGDKPMLLECVALVDARMRQVKASSKLQGADRIAVMAALTLARDVLGGGALQDAGTREEALKKITAISQTLDAALVPQEKLF
jgi:cell division protein ZapA